jgi:translocator protein
MTNSTLSPLNSKRPQPTVFHLWLGLFAFLVVCFGVGIWTGLITFMNIDIWYRTLNKPSWTPPNTVFGPVWNVIYMLMAIAGWMVWARMGFAGLRTEVILFVVQLALNPLWTYVFFCIHRPDLSLIIAVLLWLTVAAMAALFWRVRKMAGYLLFPYLGWLAFAIALNFAIWRMNANL